MTSIRHHFTTSGTPGTLLLHVKDAIHEFSFFTILRNRINDEMLKVDRLLVIEKQEATEVKLHYDLLNFNNFLNTSAAEHIQFLQAVISEYKALQPQFSKLWEAHQNMFVELWTNEMEYTDRELVLTLAFAENNDEEVRPWVTHFKVEELAEDSGLLLEVMTMLNDGDCSSLKLPGCTQRWDNFVAYLDKMSGEVGGHQLIARFKANLVVCRSVWALRVGLWVLQKLVQMPTVQELMDIGFSLVSLSIILPQYFSWTPWLILSDG